MQHDTNLARLPTWTPPKVFDEYRLVRPLGRGGMGEVYLAHDRVLDRPVAVKFISTMDPEVGVRDQFLTEARAAARVQHPNVLTIFRVGELSGRPFIISEFVRGKSLDTIGKPMAWRRALELGIGLSRGLAAAHRRGVLHRDIKPANAVLADDGAVKLLDFGLAKFVERVGGERLSWSSGGTSESPEPPAPELSPNDPTLPQPFAPMPGRPAPMAEEAVESRVAQVAEEAVAPADDVILFAAKSDPRNDFTPTMPSSIPPKSGDTVRRPREVAHLTMVRGTPLYMAPEIWRGESATRRSDVYSLGALLFELCAGEAPHKGVPVHMLGRHTARRDAKPLLQAAPSVDPRLAAIVDRCLDREPEARFASGDELREALEQILPAHRRDSMPEGNPYRGLLPFEAEHRALFFGRSAEIGTVVERLRAESFLVIAGDSGVGKSSLCRAGVLPMVGEGALGGGRTWFEVHVVPGRTPLAAITAALSPLLGTGAEKLATQLRAEPAALGRALGKQLGDTGGAVIFMDQLEELVTVSDPSEAEVVGLALGHLANAVPGVRLLVTVRSDFLARVASVPGLGDEISRGVYFLRPLSRENVRDAIVGPARAKGVSFQSRGVVEALIAATVRAEGGLPLLQFALAELWEARGKLKGVITAESLEAIGGVAGALARHADHVLLGLPQDRRASARRVLMSLVTLDGTRARRTGAELEAGDPAVHEVIEALVRGRLLVVHDTEHGLSYELAHEALLKGWTTLRGWLDKQADSRPVKQRLEASVAEWKRLGHAREALWSARRLAEAAIVHPGDLTPHEAAFLDASQRAVRRLGLARKAALVAVPLLLGALYGVIQVVIRSDVAARVDVHADQGRAILAEAGWKNDEVNALRAKAFAAFDARRQAEGEAMWAEALALSSELDRTYGRASQSLESALTIDASRTDVRDLLGDALLDRALAAERDGRAAQRDDLLQRMALHDVSGERRRRWGAPAELVLESSPPGARVTLEPFVEDERQRRVLSGPRDLGRAPITEPGIEPGSHMITVSAENRAIVRYPVVLGRGERLRLVIATPTIAEIPEGFVYVPPGRFLFGSSADELARREFLAAVPLHQVTTGAYLIAREETTYAQWIDYLRELPPEERARRAPKVGQAGLNGALELAELPWAPGARTAPHGDWQLAFQPTTQSYKARLGEKITYATRSLRATQDWSRFPVAGISSADAAAYAAWLDGTGRVRGARLCTEQEWERAARGADDREFPSGGRLAPDDANFDATYGGVPNMGPDEVGSHPASRSPFGLDDMTGNIFEWTRSSLAPGEAVVRGGAYYYGRMTNRSTNRTVFPETLRDPRVGLRLCASAPDP